MKDFKTVLSYENPDKHALSVYLKGKKGFPSAKALLPQFKNMAKKLPERSQKALHKEINSITSLLRSHPPEGAGIAIFASPDRFISLKLETAPPRTLVQTDKHWVVFPLVYAKQFEAGALLVLVKKRETVLLRVSGDGTTRLQRITEEEKERSKRIAFFGKDEDFSAIQKRMAEQIGNRIITEETKQELPVLIVGETKTLQAFVPELPEDLPKRAIQITRHLARESEAWIKATVRSELKKSHKKKVARLLEEIQSAKPEKTATTAKETFEAIQEGRAKDVLISITDPIPGAICQKCDYLLPARLKGCPICNEKTLSKDDITDLLVRKALETSDDVVLTTKKLRLSTSALATLRY